MYIEEKQKEKEKPAPEPTRFVIYPNDIANHFGVHKRTARKLFVKMKVALKKKAEHMVTYREFCKYFGVSVEEMKKRLKTSWIPLLATGYFLWFFKDDMDLGLTYILIFFAGWQVRKWKRRSLNTATPKAVDKQKRFSRSAAIYPLFVGLILSVSSFTQYFNLPPSASAGKQFGPLFGGVMFGLIFFVGVLGMMGVRVGKTRESRLNQKKTS